MEFAFTDEQQMIRDTAEAFLKDTSTSEAVRAAMVTELGYDAELWQRLCGEMYWQAIHIPEAYGGLGLSYVELVAIMEQMGRYLLCAPYFSTVCLATNALLCAASEEQKAEHLGAICEGRSATLAWQSGRDGSAAGVSGVGGRVRRLGAAAREPSPRSWPPRPRSLRACPRHGLRQPWRGAPATAPRVAGPGRSAQSAWDMVCGLVSMTPRA